MRTQIGTNAATAQTGSAPADEASKPARRLPGAGAVARLVVELRQGVRGEILHAAEEIAPYSRDWSGLPGPRPLVVVRPSCEADIVHTLRVANGARVPVAVRGTGHACGGQSLVEGGIVIHNLSPTADFQVLSGGRVETSTSTRWYDLERGLNREGRSAPILPDFLDLSVGGTLSSAGIGHRSIVQGCQADHVEAYRVIRADGTVVSCSARETPDLMAVGLGGLGQIGILSRVIMRTVPRTAPVRLEMTEHRSLKDFLRTIERLPLLKEDGPDHFSAEAHRKESRTNPNPENVVSRMGYSETGALGAKPRPGGGKVIEDWQFVSHQRTAEWVNRYHGHYRFRCDYVFELEGFAAFMERLGTWRRTGPLGRTLELTYILAIRRPSTRFAFMFDPAPRGAETMLFYAGLYHMVPRDRPVLLHDMQESVTRTLSACVDLGGRPYLSGCHPLGENMMRRLYGREYERFAALRSEADPNGILHTGLVRPRGAC